MKRGLLVFTIVLLVCVFASGCADQGDAQKIVGTWEFQLSESGHTYYQKYIFKKNGSGSFREVNAQGPTPGEFRYELKDNGIIMLTYNSGMQLTGQYKFNEDYTAVTLKFSKKSVELQKAEN